MDRILPDDLLRTSKGKNREQYTCLQIALSIERTFNWKGRTFGVFGGGYLRLKIQDWFREHRNTTLYFTDIEYEQIYDSIHQTHIDVITNKTQLTTPITKKNKDQWDSGANQSLNYGLQAGIHFPLVKWGEGRLSGQLIVAQDFKDYYWHTYSPKFRQTSITGGVVFTPTIAGQPHPRKPEKRILSSGIYSGVSIHNFYVSVNGAWHSRKQIGFDFSARPIFVIKDHATIYFGPNYRLWNSRFFAKSGMEYFWTPNSEGYDEAFYRVHVGGKYIAPFSKRLGLQVDFGYYFKPFIRLKESHEAHIGLGVGVVLLPFAKG